MPMHLAGYMQQIDSAGVFTAVTPLADPMLFIQGNNIRVPTSTPNIAWAAGGADGVVQPRWRLTSPSLIARQRLEVKPLNVQNAAAVVPDSPPAIHWFTSDPVALEPDELLFAELNNNPAAAQFQWCLVQFADAAPTPIGSANVQTGRWTSATASVAGAWTNVVITPDDNLQPGNYAVVGMRAQATNIIAARMVFNNDPGHRPGCIGSANAAGKSDRYFRDGNLGVWGTFPFTQLPTIDVLSAAADATQEFELDLVKIG